MRADKHTRPASHIFRHTSSSGIHLLQKTTPDAYIYSDTNTPSYEYIYTNTNTIIRIHLHGYEHTIIRIHLHEHEDIYTNATTNILHTARLK